MSLKNFSTIQLWGLGISCMVMAIGGPVLARTWSLKGPMETVVMAILAGLVIGVALGICALIEKRRKR